MEGPSWRRRRVILRATTTAGIEDLALSELVSCLTSGGYQPYKTTEKWCDLPGIVSVELDLPPSVGLFEQLLRTAHLRLIYHLTVHVVELEWDGRSIESLLRGIGAAEFDVLGSAESFRVTCSRAGDHEFQSPDVERAVGAQIVERYGARVDLEQFSVQIKIDIVGDRAFAGYQLTGRKGLDRRYPWRYRPRVSLRTPIAYAMLSLSGFLESPGPLLDPFCGSGTILMEAASVSRLTGHDIALHGRDWDAAAVDGAVQNIEAAGLAGISIAKGDARAISEVHAPGSLEYIVTNPPFGIRLARVTNFQGFYASFLRSAAIVLKEDGVLCLLVGKRKASFARALQQFPEFAFLSARTIEMGGVYPSLQIVRRTNLYSGDPISYHPNS